MADSLLKEDGSYIHLEDGTNHLLLDALVGLTYTGLALLGATSLATKKTTSTRRGVTADGTKALAARSMAERRAAVVAVGEKTSASRKVTLSRPAASRLGIKVIPARKTAVKCIGLICDGITDITSRKLSSIRVGAIAQGLKVFVSKAAHLTVSGLIKTGVSVYGAGYWTHLSNLTFTGLIKTGQTILAGRKTTNTLRSLIAVGVKTTATRPVAYRRLALSTLGFVLNANRIVSALRPATTQQGLSVLAEFVYGLLMRVDSGTGSELGGPGTSEVYENFFTEDHNMTLNPGPASWRGQTFTPESSHVLTDVYLYARRAASAPADTITLSIRATTLTKFESFEGGDGSSYFNGTIESNWLAQTFNPFSTHKLTHVKLYMSRTGSPTSFTVRIRDTEYQDGYGWRPVGADKCSATVAASAIPVYPEFAWVQFDFSSPITINQYTNYAIVGNCVGVDIYNYINVALGDTPAYPLGNYVYSWDYGVYWNANPAYDVMFQEWGPGIPTGSDLASTTVSTAAWSESNEWHRFSLTYPVIADTMYAIIVRNTIWNSWYMCGITPGEYTVGSDVGPLGDSWFVSGDNWLFSEGGVSALATQPIAILTKAETGLGAEVRWLWLDVFYKALAGTLTISGSAGIKSLIKLAGVLTSAGTLFGLPVVLFYKALTGTLTAAGSLSIKIAAILAGILTSSGLLSYYTKLYQYLSGALTPAGAVGHIQVSISDFIASVIVGVKPTADRTTQWLRNALVNVVTRVTAFFVPVPRTVVKVPLIEVYVYRFAGTVPGVDTDGVEYKFFNGGASTWNPAARSGTGVVSSSLSFGYDQVSATATIVLQSPLDLNGDPVVFKPMDRVVVKEGWDDTSSLRTTFFGFVDQVSLTNPEKLQKLECRDILKLAQNNYYVHSSRKVISAVEILDDGETMGGQSLSERQVESVISMFLEESGIPTQHQKLPVTNITLGGTALVNNSVLFEYESAMDAIQRICDLIGYKVWADPQGIVQMRELDTIASEGASLTFQTQQEYHDGETFIVQRRGNIINIESTVDDDLRNWITVSYPDDPELTVTIAGASPYIPIPYPQYRKAEITSHMYDTPEMLETIAERVYNELNRLRYSARLKAEGNPRIELGQTIRIVDEDTVGSMNYFVYDYSVSHSSSGYFVDITLVGGAGEGSPAQGNIAPRAIYHMETPNKVGSYYDVWVDASDSKDPDGSIASYLWESSGFTNGTGVMQEYLVPTTETSITIKLTVTDDDGLTDSVTKTHSLTSGGGGNVSDRAIFYASGTNVYATDDSGDNWTPFELS